MSERQSLAKNGHSLKEEPRGRANAIRSACMNHSPKIRLRIILNPGTLIGWGKADLLQAIDETGSISEAGRRMGMSYKRAWTLINTMNAYFQEPLVASTRGGSRGGGAQLTKTGRAVLETYRRIEKKVHSVSERDLKMLTSLAAK